MNSVEAKASLQESIRSSFTGVLAAMLKNIKCMHGALHAPNSWSPALHMLFYSMTRTSSSIVYSRLLAVATELVYMHFPSKPARSWSQRNRRNTSQISLSVRCCHALPLWPCAEPCAHVLSQPASTLIIVIGHSVPPSTKRRC
jgi:hypothetical protein